MNRGETSIFDLLPIGKFHSCFVTGFTFDFHHFEMVAMSHFRRAGVSNVAVFVDSNMLTESLGKITGATTALSRTYSLHGLRRPGAFHPKVMLFFGKDSGFLILGSGNLTFSGHGGNDEIWGAFHIQDRNDPQFPLFLSAWQVMERFKDEIAGATKKQFEWAIKESPWLGDMNSEQKIAWNTMDDHRSACLLTNTKGPLFDSITDLVPNSINLITILSPFFDSAAGALEDLASAYPHAHLQVILQPETSFAPKTLAKNLRERITFHDWDKIDGVESKKPKYLHAKLLYFSNTKEEFYVFGSANCTRAALGAKEQNAKNEEACIIFRSNKIALKDDLGLMLKDTEISFEDVQSRQKQEPPKTDTVVHYQIHLAGAEKYGSNIRLFCDNPETILNETIAAFDTWGERLFDIVVKKENTSTGYFEIPSQLSLVIKAIYIQVFSTKDKSPISNKQVLHDLISLAKCNPNSKIKKIEDLFESLSAGAANIFDLFRHLDLNELLEERQINRVKNTDGSKVGSPEEQDGLSAKDQGRVLSTEEFKALGDKEDEVALLLNSVHQSGIVRAFEIFQSIFNQKLEGKTQATTDDEELDNLDESSGREDDPFETETVSKVQPVTRSKYLQIQKLVLRFFKNYCNILKKQIDREDKPTLVDLSMFCLATRLLTQVVEMPLEISDEGNVKDYVLKWSGDPIDEDCYSSILISVIGHATRFFISGINVGDDELLKERIDTFRKAALIHAIYCVATLPQNASYEDGPEPFWEDWVWSSYLNARHYLGQECGAADLSVNLKSHIATQVETTSVFSKISVDHVFSQFEKLEEWWNEFKDPKKLMEIETKKNNVRVFSDLHGYCIIRKNYAEGQRRNIIVTRPGFEYNEDINDFKCSSFHSPPAKFLVPAKKF